MTSQQTLVIKSPQRQQGAALLILLTIIMLAASYSLLKRLNKEQPDILRDSNTTAVLAEAKTALIGYALSSSVRPGELPCPDYGLGAGGLDGLSDVCNENVTYVSIGRLPWKTLGLRDLRDASGESLWYAPAIEFDGNTVINSETTASLKVTNNIAVEIAAVIIAPGKATSTQVRSQNLAAQTTPGRYLEASNTTADDNISVVAPNLTTEFTDHVMVISRDELMQPVERLVLAKMKVFIDSLGSLPSPASSYLDDCSPMLSQGFLPGNCPAGITISWPNWFTSNNWQTLVWYAMDLSAGLSVREGANNTAGIVALLAAAGPALPGQDRSPTPPPLTSLLEQANADNNLNFEILPVSPLINDQLLIIR